MNQEKLVLDYLRKHDTITQREAIKYLGVMRLSAIIHNLRKQGENIIGWFETCENRYGKRVHFKRYRLEK